MRTYLVKIPEVYVRTIKVEAADHSDAMHRVTVLKEGEDNGELRYKRTLDVSDWEVVPEIVEGLFERTIVALDEMVSWVAQEYHPVNPILGNAIEVLSDVGQWGELLNKGDE